MDGVEVDVADDVGIDLVVCLIEAMVVYDIGNCDVLVVDDELMRDADLDDDDDDDGDADVD